MLPIAVSLTGLQFSPRDDSDTSPRGRLAWVAAPRRLRPSAVVLDATAPGLRPRELDRSARRDLAGTIRRSGLAFVGLDLLIPPKHFTDPVHSDRALAAVLAALELAADLARIAGLVPTQAKPWVTSEFDAVPASELRAAISAAAQHLGTTFAELLASPTSTSTAPASSPITTPEHAALDPAALILRGLDPVAQALALSSALAAPRLSDATGGVRCTLGQGRLDTAAYQAAVSGANAVPCLDLRQLPDANAALEAALLAWHTPTRFHEA